MTVTGKSDVGELVGRSQELERLLALLEDARAGRGRAALVLGEAGIGKTRLTEAFAAAAGQMGFASRGAAALTLNRRRTGRGASCCARFVGRPAWGRHGRDR